MGNTNVSAIVLHPKAQGRLVGLSIHFPLVLDQSHSTVPHNTSNAHLLTGTEEQRVGWSVVLEI